MLEKNIVPTNLLAEIEQTEELFGTLIIMAHHDSKSQTLTTVQRSACLIFGVVGLIIAIIGFLFKPLCILLSIPLVNFFSYWGYVGAVIAVIFAAILVLNSTTNNSPGALDNGSGVAAVWILGQYFKLHPLSNLKIQLLITGAEEYGMLGAHAFVNAHKVDLKFKPAFVLNFDMIGQKDGLIQIIEKSGFPIRKSTNVTLNPLAHQMAKELNIHLIGFWLPIGASTDRYVFSNIGIEGVDFFNGKAAMATHSPNDTIARFDGQKAAQNVAIAARMGEELNKTVANGGK